MGSRPGALRDDLISKSYLKLPRESSSEDTLTPSPQLQWEKFIKQRGADLPPGLRQELAALGQESDREVFYRDLQTRARELQASGSIKEAVLLYEFILSSSENGSSPGESIKRQASLSYNALLQRGPLVPQIEFQMSRFIDEVTHPIALSSMVAAGLTYGSVRWATFAGLGRFPAVSWLTRGWGAQVLASVAGLGAESGAFLGVERGLSSLTGHRKSLTAATLSQEYWSLALMLGLLRASGGLTRSLLSLPSLRVRSTNTWLHRVPHIIAPQAAMYASILGAHSLETQLGWRKPMETSPLALGALITLLQFNAMGRLTENALGEGYANLNRDLHRRGDRLGQSLKNLGVSLLPQSVQKIIPAGTGALGKSPWHVFMSVGGENGNGNGRSEAGTPDRKPVTLDPQDYKTDAPGSEESNRQGTMYKPSESEPITLGPQELELVDSLSPPPPSDPLLGIILGKRYMVDAILGQGGMGVVYRGHHVVLNKTVAIKVLRAEYSRDSELMERFINEAKAASAIGNAHIIDVTDVGRLKDRSTYMVMEYLQGNDLYDVIDGHPLPVDKILHISRQMALGMEAAHKMGIVHRDLKPDNIFLVTRGSEQDFVKILDFGIAKFSSDSKLTRPGEVFGTPHYMSPEQAGGHPVDQRSDIYAMGVIMYEMASGKVPFDGDTPLAILQQHLTKSPQPLRISEETRLNIPEDLEKIIFKCLEKHPQNRYQNMGELYADLNALKQGIAPSEPPRVPFKPPWRIIGGVSGLLAMGGLGWYFLRDESSPDGISSPPATSPEPSAESSIVSPPNTTENQETPNASPLNIEDLPKEPPPTQEVIITVEPINAHIYIDGKDFGTSPVSIQLNDNEKVEVKINKKGYVSKTLTLDGAKPKVSVKLKPLFRQTAPSSAPRPSPPKPSSPRLQPTSPPKKDDGVVNPW